MTDNAVKSDMICPQCGCREPKTLVDGHYRCDSCTCGSTECGSGAGVTEPRTLDLFST